MHLIVANGHKHFDTFPDAFAFTEDALWREFLPYCAEQGFWTLSDTAVGKLAEKEFDLRSPNTTDMLIGVIMPFLDCAEEKAVRCLEHRLAHFDSLVSSYDDILETDEFYDAVDDDTREAAAKHAQHTNGARERHQATQNEVLARIKKIREAREAAKLPRARKRQQTSRASSSGVRRTEPAPLPVDESLYTVEFVRQFCPPNTRIHQDIFEGRWQLWWRLEGPPPGPWRSISRSWGIRTQRSAVAQCLHEVWRWAQAETDCECPVLALFSADPVVEHGAASSANT